MSQTVWSARSFLIRDSKMWSKRKRSVCLFSCVAVLFGVSAASGQDQDIESFPPVAMEDVARYTAYRTNQPIEVDGKLDEASWEASPRSPRFVDLIRGTPTFLETRAAVLWDDDFLYVGFWIEDPFVTAKFTERDDPIWQDNDVEVFIAGPHAYYEFEINALGTIYEGLFVWQSAYEEFGFRDFADINVDDASVRSQPFNGVGLRDHPRGPRWAFLDWDFSGLRSAVHVEGTLNDDRDRDRGWTVEIAIPWDGMETLVHGGDQPAPPREHDVWRMDFSRFNQFRESLPAVDSGGWAWSYHGVWDSHIPECFPVITFSSRDVTSISEDDQE